MKEVINALYLASTIACVFYLGWLSGSVKTEIKNKPIKTQGRITDEPDTIEVKEYRFESYSPLVEQRKNKRAIIKR